MVMAMAIPHDLAGGFWSQNGPSRDRVQIPSPSTFRNKGVTCLSLKPTLLRECGSQREI